MPLVQLDTGCSIVEDTRKDAGPVVQIHPAESRARILVVDADQRVQQTVAHVLRDSGYEVTGCTRAQDGLRALDRGAFDVLLVDLDLPQVSGLELIRTACARREDTLGIVTTANPSMPSCVEALAQGAWEYLPKPFSAGHLQIVIGRAVRALLAAREARGELAEIAHQYGHGDRMALLGKAAVFRRAMEVARKVAPTDASVLITGESGTGKELIARFIHEHSKRATHPFVAINCAAVPEGLLESEMFGHRKGAFSGADHEKVGLFEAAHRGTLFLDELAEMPRAMQTKLLRVIQDGVVRRVGSETTDAIVNVRFVAATNRDLEVAVATGQLREDLYYRLCVVPIHVPPLRARSVDIPVLAEYFLTAYWVRHRPTGTPRPTLTWEAIEALRRHPWRGNVRELQNVIEHTAVLVEPGAAIGPAELPLSGETQSVSPLNETECVTTERARSPTPRTMDAAYRETLDSFVTLCEREYVLRLLHANAGNVSRAARAAGVDRTTLYRIMQRLGVQRNGEGAAAERTTEGLSRRGGTSIPNAPRPVVRASVGQAMHSAARS